MHLQRPVEERRGAVLNDARVPGPGLAIINGGNDAGSLHHDVGVDLAAKVLALDELEGDRADDVVALVLGLDETSDAS